MLSVLLTSDRLMLRSIQSQMWDIHTWHPRIQASVWCIVCSSGDDVYVKFAGVWLKLSSNEIAEDRWCYATLAFVLQVCHRQVWFHLLHWWLSGSFYVFPEKSLTAAFIYALFFWVIACSWAAIKSASQLESGQNV